MGGEHSGTCGFIPHPGFAITYPQHHHQTLHSPGLHLFICNEWVGWWILTSLGSQVLGQPDESYGLPPKKNVIHNVHVQPQEDCGTRETHSRVLTEEHWMTSQFSPSLQVL